jgi:hypothetical protein
MTRESQHYETLKFSTQLCIRMGSICPCQCIGQIESRRPQLQQPNGHAKLLPGLAHCCALGFLTYVLSSILISADYRNYTTKSFLFNFKAMNYIHLCTFYLEKNNRLSYSTIFQQLHFTPINAIKERVIPDCSL